MVGKGRVGAMVECSPAGGKALFSLPYSLP